VPLFFFISLVRLVISIPAYQKCVQPSALIKLFLYANKNEWAYLRTRPEKQSIYLCFSMSGSSSVQAQEKEENCSLYLSVCWCREQSNLHIYSSAICVNLLRKCVYVYKQESGYYWLIPFALRFYLSINLFQAIDRQIWLRTIDLFLKMRKSFIKMICIYVVRFITRSYYIEQMNLEIKMICIYLSKTASSIMYVVLFDVYDRKSSLYIHRIETKQNYFIFLFFEKII